MKRSSFILGCTLAASLLAATALGGQSVGIPVQLIGGDSVVGMLVQARNSADPNQRIGCSTSSYPGGEFGACYAETADGTQVMCITYEPTMIADARALDNEGYLQFGWDKTGRCTYLVRWTSSEMKP